MADNRLSTPGKPSQGRTGSSATLAGSPHRIPRIAALALFLTLSALLPCLATASARILVDGRTLSVSPTPQTVREALDEAKITLGEADQVTPSLSSSIPADGSIRVSRVTFREGAIDTRVPYRIIVRTPSPGNRPYHPTVTAPGRNGLKRVTYRARLVDGVEADRVTVNEVVLREPIHQIVTSRAPQQLASRGAYGGQKSFRMLSSAYDPGPGSCGKYANGKTCNGKRAGYGIIAVDPKLIPLGTKLFVPGYGYGIAADVGRAIKGLRVDLGFNSRSGSMQWGRKWVMVSVVD